MKLSFYTTFMKSTVIHTGLILCLLFMPAISACCYAQKPFQIDEQRILKNENLDGFITRLQTEHFTFFNTKDKIPTFIKEQLPINDSDLANPDEPFTSSDVVFDATLPFRQLRFGAISNDLVILSYIKEGFASFKVIWLIKYKNNTVEDVWLNHTFCEDVNSIKGILDCLNENYKDKPVTGQMIEH